MDIHRQDLGLQLSSLLLLGLGRLFVFLDIELPQQHNCLLSKDATGDRIWLVDAGTIEGLVMVMWVWVFKGWRTQNGS